MFSQIELSQTVDAEIKRGMISQRAGDAENPAEAQPRKWTAEGMRKSEVSESMALRVGIRQFPEV